MVLTRISHLTHQIYTIRKYTTDTFRAISIYITSGEAPASDIVIRIDTIMWNRVPQDFLYPDTNPNFQRENEMIQIGDLPFEFDVVSFKPERPCDTP